LENFEERINTIQISRMITSALANKGAFTFWMQSWGAKPQSMGYLPDSIHSRIERRPDTLESILCDAEA